jgi:hypothetical protein
MTQASATAATEFICPDPTCNHPGCPENPTSCPFQEVERQTAAQKANAAQKKREAESQNSQDSQVA